MTTEIAAVPPQVGDKLLMSTVKIFPLTATLMKLYFDIVMHSFYVRKVLNLIDFLSYKCWINQMTNLRHGQGFSSNYTLFPIENMDRRFTYSRLGKRLLVPSSSHS